MLRADERVLVCDRCPWACTMHKNAVGDSGHILHDASVRSLYGLLCILLAHFGGRNAHMRSAQSEQSQDCLILGRVQSSMITILTALATLQCRGLYCIDCGKSLDPSYGGYNTRLGTAARAAPPLVAASHAGASTADRTLCIFHLSVCRSKVSIR